MEAITTEKAGALGAGLFDVSGATEKGTLSRSPRATPRREQAYRRRVTNKRISPIVECHRCGEPNRATSNCNWCGAEICPLSWRFVNGKRVAVGGRPFVFYSGERPTWS